jgi:transposase
MYSSEITNRFIELRSQDISLDCIAKQLGINKSTAIDWQRRYKPRIAELKALHFEAICEKLATRYEDEVGYAMGELNRIRAELKRRKVEHVSTEFLYHAEAMAYRRVQKLAALAELPDGPVEDDAQPTPEENPTVSQPFPHQSQGEVATSPVIESHDSANAEESSVAPPLPRGEGRGEGQTGSCAAFVGDPTPPENPTKTQPFPHQKLGSGDDAALACDESIVIGPDEPGSSIAKRCGITLSSEAVESLPRIHP